MVTRLVGCLVVVSLVSGFAILAAPGAVTLSAGQPVPRVRALPCPPRCATETVQGALHLTHTGMADLRAAAWRLVLPFTKASQGLPDPREWTSVTSLFPFRTAADGPFRLKLDQLRQLRRQKVDLYEATFVNMTARRFIEGRGLNIRSTTEALRAAFVREIEMPPDSKAVKMFFYRVRHPEEVPVRLWDWNQIRVVDGANLDDREMRSQCVQVTPSRTGCAAAKENFYTVTVDDANKAFFTCGKDCPPRLQRGDVMVLVAMHITSKQTPEWLWATFWWRGPVTYSGSYWTCQDAQRPPELKTTTPWNQYSMDTAASLRIGKPMRPAIQADLKCGAPPTLGNPQNPDPAAQQFRATYNPFVEAGLANGLKSSCVNCHARATTSNTTDQKPPSLADRTSPFLLDFEGHIRLDYLWSLGRTLAPTIFPEGQGSR